MNKIYPLVLETNSDSIVANTTFGISMAGRPTSNQDRLNVSLNLVTPCLEVLNVPDNAIITIKEEATYKQDNSSQVSAFVKFIKSSLSSHKKKADTNTPVNHKSTLSPRGNSQINEKTNSDMSLPTVTPSFHSSNDLSCRFCQELEPEVDLVTPCLCSGTMKYIHQSCLQRWIKTQDNRFCELCKYEFHMKITTKPLREWHRLEMSVLERRKVICSVTFHVIALTCVIWSLYVLIERTTEEMRDGRLEWPFWTKLIVVAIGFIGGVVFMYVQCRMYVHLCRKWHAFNRTFVVQSISCTERVTAQRQARSKTEASQKTAREATHVGGDVPLSRVAVVETVPVSVSSNDDMDCSLGPSFHGSFEDRRAVDRNASVTWST